MDSRPLADALYEELKSVVEGEGVVLVDVEMVPGPSVLFRFVIDGDGGVAIEDCVRVDRAVPDFLEEWDRKPERYGVEVTSPGLDRKIRRIEEYDHFRTRSVRIHAEGDESEVREYRGLLGGMEGEDVLLEQEGETLRIPVERIRKARLLFKPAGGADARRKK